MRCYFNQPVNLCSGPRRDPGQIPRHLGPRCWLTEKHSPSKKNTENYACGRQKKRDFCIISLGRINLEGDCLWKRMSLCYLKVPWLGHQVGPTPISQAWAASGWLIAGHHRDRKLIAGRTRLDVTVARQTRSPRDLWFDAAFWRCAFCKATPTAREMQESVVCYVAAGGGDFCPYKEVLESNDTSFVVQKRSPVSSTLPKLYIWNSCIDSFLSEAEKTALCVYRNFCVCTEKLCVCSENRSVCTGTTCSG